MAEGEYTLSWGCLVSQDLAAVGAGKHAWLDDRSLVVAMGRGLVALAKQQTLVVTGWSGAGAFKDSVEPGFSTVVPTLDSSERVTALEWLLWDGWSVLAIGTSIGNLCFYSETGLLLVQQNLNAGGGITHLHARSSQRGQESAEELSIAFQHLIARVDALDLQSQLRRRIVDAESSRWVAEAQTTRLPYQMWSIRSSSSNYCTDAAITGVVPPSLFEQQSRQRYFCGITVGADSTLAAFRLSEDRRHSLTDLIFSRVVPATVSRIASFAKALRRTERPPEPRPAEVKPQEFSRASLITALRDPPRKGESLALSPNQSLAAVTDSLGRVLLVDVHALVVVRLWKGYRDAHCKFLEAPIDGVSGLQNARRQSCVKADFCLCLAIHAPRRGVVEIWKMRNGPRLSIIKLTEKCRLLQPPCKLWTSQGTGNDSSDNGYVPQLAYILNGDSSLLSVINPFLPARQRYR